MFEITKMILGYLPQNFWWVYMVVILLLFFVLFGIIVKLLGGNIR